MFAYFKHSGRSPSGFNENNNSHALMSVSAIGAFSNSKVPNELLDKYQIPGSCCMLYPVVICDLFSAV